MNTSESTNDAGAQPACQHTPGPWRAVKSTCTEGFWIIESDTGDVTYISLVPNVGTLEANVRLIAAAPELLEALREVDQYLTGQAIYGHGVMRGNGDEHSITPAKLVRAATAKAEGRS